MTKLHETIADIAYLAGHEGYYSGDSRDDMRRFVYWAEEFQKLHKDTDWGNNDYMLEVEAFTYTKLNQTRLWKSQY